MATLHPSNPYYTHLSHHLDAQSQTILQPYEPKHQQPQRSLSDTTALQRHHQPKRTYQSTHRTHSITGPFSAFVPFEGTPTYIDTTSPPHPAEIIIATVRITNSFRHASLTPSSSLPDRPPPRSFLRRMSTRMSGARDENRYTAIKMPRKDYERFFKRDREGRYAGTEWPEREWSEWELEVYFGRFQGMALRSIPDEPELETEKGGVERRDSAMEDDGNGNWKREEEGGEHHGKR